MADPTRRMRRAVRYVKRAKKLYKFYKKLPGFDVRMTEGEYEFKTVKGPGMEFLFYPVTKPIEMLVSKLPPFRKPKRGFKRMRGLNEKEIPY